MPQLASHFEGGTGIGYGSQGAWVWIFDSGFESWVFGSRVYLNHWGLLVCVWVLGLQDVNVVQLRVLGECRPECKNQTQASCDTDPNTVPSPKGGSHFWHFRSRVGGRGMGMGWQGGDSDKYKVCVGHVSLGHEQVLLVWLLPTDKCPQKVQSLGGIANWREGLGFLSLEASRRWGLFHARLEQ